MTPKYKYHFHLPTAKERQNRKELQGKLTCPKCGKKTFVPYLDANGKIVDKAKYGRCERVNSCAYIKYPSSDKAPTKTQSTAKTQTRPKPKATFLNEKQREEIFKPSLSGYDMNHLITFLKGLFDEGMVDQIITEYFIGTSQHFNGGATVFWQIDRYSNIHRGKVMQYDPNTGKRVKIKGKGLVTSIHSLNDLGDLPPQCLFGEHLLPKYPDMFVGIVESEKTAIIASGVITDCIFLACGGCQNLTIAMCKPLRGRNVVLFPDNGRFTRYQDKNGKWQDGWSEKGKQLRHLFKTLQIADIMERPDIMEQYDLKDGDDIGDLIIARNLDIKGLDLGFKEL